MSNSLSGGHENEHEFQPTPAHHPSAPSHELFDISTTVDPSYMISLIRRLLSSDVQGDNQAVESGCICYKPKTVNGIAEAMGSSGNNSELNGLETRNEDRIRAVEKTWEECGCILWDLSANEDHAQFMVQNLILDVLLANLVVSQSSRITEISLGIIGNLACHEIPRNQIASKNGLVRAIVEQLLLDDIPCLGEACRLLTLCLQGSEGIIWAEALKAGEIISRILWIAQNALNPQLLEKIVGLLLAILESRQEVAAILIPPMLDLGISSLLIKLLDFEMSTLKGERIPQRYTVLDLVLRAIEALSTMVDYSQEICQNKELAQLAKELIELPDNFEVASSRVTAAVLVANILTDATDLTSELSQDLNFLQGIIDVLPFASDDTEAKKAIWSIIARILKIVKVYEMSTSIFHSLVSVFASKLDLIEDELLVRPLDHQSSGIKTNPQVIAMKIISSILSHWKSSDDMVTSASSIGDYVINEDDVDKLLDLLKLFLQDVMSESE